MNLIRLLPGRPVHIHREPYNYFTDFLVFYDLYDVFYRRIISPDRAKRLGNGAEGIADGQSYPLLPYIKRKYPHVNLLSLLLIRHDRGAFCFTQQALSDMCRARK